MRIFLLIVVLFFCVSCGSEDDDSATIENNDTDTFENNPSLTGLSFITYTYSNNVYRIVPLDGQSPQNVSQTLNALSSGSDSWLNIAKNGQWYLIETERFGCGGWACLAVINSDLNSGNAVKLADDSVVHPEGFSAISNDGRAIVYPYMSASERMDLFIITSGDGLTWSQPVNITSSSVYAYNNQPSLNSSGTFVVFDCGTAQYSTSGTAICKVKIDGSQFEIVAVPAQGPGGSAANALHHPGFNPDGTIIFEADWDHEQVWKKNGGAFTVINNMFNNDNSPCVLSSDGRIASLWLDRPGGTGAHELKIMNSDGSGSVVLLPDMDIADVGIGCSE